jgi:hypothetical protein
MLNIIHLFLSSFLQSTLYVWMHPKTKSKILNLMEFHDDPGGCCVGWLALRILRCLHISILSLSRIMFQHFDDGY